MVDKMKVENLGPVNVTSQMVNGYQSFSFSGKLTYGNTNLAKEQVQGMIKEAKDYIVDMSKLDYIDSTGLGFLMNFAKQVSLNNKRVVIVLKNNFIKELFEIAKFHLVFPITGSEQEAISVLEKGYESIITLDKY